MAEMDGWAAELGRVSPSEEKREACEFLNAMLLRAAGIEGE